MAQNTEYVENSIDELRIVSAMDYASSMFTNFDIVSHGFFRLCLKRSSNINVTFLGIKLNFLVLSRKYVHKRASFIVSFVSIQVFR